MQTNIPNLFIGCQLNLSIIPHLLKKLGSNIFITVPNHSIEGGQKEISVWLGDPQDVMCLANGEVKINPNDEYVSDTAIIIQGFNAEDLLEIMADFRQKFEPVKVPNMVVWLPKKITWF